MIRLRPDGQGAKESIITLLGREFGSRYYENRLLAEFTTVGVGGVADFLVIAESASELEKAVELAVRFGYPYVVISGGSNVLASDIGFPGLVVINRSSQFVNLPSGQVIVESGLANDQLVNRLASLGLGGVEFLAGIPGSIGGAVATNATWEHHQTNQYVKELKILTFENKQKLIVTLPGTAFKTSPYLSDFLSRSKLSNPPVILSIRLQLANLPAQYVLERILAVRRQRSFLKKLPSVVGYFLAPRLSDLLSPKEQSALERVIRGRFSRHDRNILEIKNKENALVVRQKIEEIITAMNEPGQRVQERIGYIGYWSDDEKK